MLEFQRVRRQRQYDVASPPRPMEQVGVVAHAAGFCRQRCSTPLKNMWRTENAAQEPKALDHSIPLSELDASVGLFGPQGMAVPWKTHDWWRSQLVPL